MTSLPGTEIFEPHGTYKQFVGDEVMFTTAEVKAPDAVRDQRLRHRFTVGGTPNTVTVLVLVNGEEAGILIYEDWGRPESII